MAVDIERDVKSKARAYSKPLYSMPKRSMPREDVLKLMSEATAAEDQIWHDGKMSGVSMMGGPLVLLAHHTTYLPYTLYRVFIMVMPTTLNC